MKSINQVLRETKQKLVDIRDGKEVYYKTRYEKLNKYLGGGIIPKTINVIAGRPASGKSAFTLPLMEDILTLNNIPTVVLYFNWEMDDTQQGLRLLSSNIRSSLTEMRKGDLNDRLLEVDPIIDRLSKLPIYFYSQYISSDYLYEIIKNTQEPTKKHVVVFLDHSRLLLKNNERTEEEKISNLMFNLSRCTRELDCTVILLSQLNRSYEIYITDNKEYRVPVQTDLFGADSVGQYASTILIIHRPENYLELLKPKRQDWYTIGYRDGKPITEDPAGKIYMEIVKQRDGQSGVSLRFNHELKYSIITE